MWEFLYGAFHENFVSRLWVVDRFVYALCLLLDFFEFLIDEFGDKGL